MLAFVLLGSLALGAGQTPLSAGETPPNLLVLLTDDQRFDLLGCAGHPVVQTPHLDALAADGVRFAQAFVTTSICAASRASILTGAEESSHGYTFGMPPLSHDWVKASYPVQLRQAGYFTGFFGKFGVKVTAKDRALMFDRFASWGPGFVTNQKGERRHETDLAADRAIAFLGDLPPGKPFCLSISFNAAHAIDGNHQAGRGHYPWPPSADGLYLNQIMPKPRLGDPEIFNAQPEFLRKSMNRIRWFWRWDTAEKYQLNMRAHLRMISGIDHAVGRIMDALREHGLARNTVVVFLSDNGYYLGDRGFAGKWSHYDESLRIPMILHDPRLPTTARGQVRQEIVLNIDVAPTLLDLAGITTPDRMSGFSLRPLCATATPPNWRTHFYCEHRMEHPDIPKWEGVRSSQYSYARYLGQDPPYEFLHDLGADPDELQNLAADPAHHDTLVRLRKETAEHFGPLREQTN